ncbi:hypothetical protein QAD02_013818 [Eretmocerus hayati]|uniref:Uncharacterized protein n=1 Tax=Eretmocerus hayati TaxID=131215 RepID=A0ACC2P4M9_9HYME|nr:hypothetical protein QAD02_013818 [Eretmocerus hayati]
MENIKRLHKNTVPLLHLKNKKRKSDSNEVIQLITETVGNIQVAVQDQEVNRNPVEEVKNKVGRKAKKVKVFKEGSNKGGRSWKENTEGLSGWTIPRRAFDLAEEKGFDVRLFQAALKMSLKKEKDKADDAERLRATQENSTGPQLVNDDEISQDDSNDMNPAPDIERDIVADALGVRVKHHSNQVTRTYSRHTPESAANLYLTMNLSKEKYSYLVKELQSRNCNILPGYDTMR